MNEKFDAHLKELRTALAGLRETTEKYEGERSKMAVALGGNIGDVCGKVTDCLTKMTDALEELARGGKD